MANTHFFDPKAEIFDPYAAPFSKDDTKDKQSEQDGNDNDSGYESPRPTAAPCTACSACGGCACACSACGSSQIRLRQIKIDNVAKILVSKRPLCSFLN